MTTDKPDMHPFETGRCLYPLDARAVLTGLAGETDFVLLESSRITDEERHSYLFRHPVSILTAHRHSDLPRTFRAMQAALKQGYYLAGWWSYELGYALEPSLKPLLTRKRSADPLLWLGVYQAPTQWSHHRHGSRHAVYPCHEIGAAHALEDMQLSIGPNEYRDALTTLQSHIAAGDTYQVNYTLKGRFRYDGPPAELYLAMRSRQAVSYGAVIRMGDRWLLSLSPELFFRRQDGLITSKPMKGTIQRGRFLDEDSGRALTLSSDPKSRAENVMIVDLIRNDIGRLSIPGSVRVTDLFTVERYQTLFQMVSRIEGRCNHPAPGWAAIFNALFPCGSVTGAPKIRTMELIAALEPDTRGVYTGAIGFISPSHEAVLNVAIRTVSLSRGQGILGIGSGVTADSQPDAEYAECRLKADFLSRPRPPFKLLETLRWDPEEAQARGALPAGYFLLDLHLHRLILSARYFDIPVDRDALCRALTELAATFPLGGSSQRVRLLVDASGRITCSAVPMENAQKAPQVRIALASDPVNSGDPFLFHKTTHRERYDRAREQANAAGFFDVIFFNERGELTEGSITNLFLELDPGKLYTPPVACGLLGGTLRASLIQAGRAEVKVLMPADLKRARRVWVGNSVRGLCPAEYVD